MSTSVMTIQLATNDIQDSLHCVHVLYVKNRRQHDQLSLRQELLDESDNCVTPAITCKAETTTEPEDQ